MRQSSSRFVRWVMSEPSCARWAAREAVRRRRAAWTTIHRACQTHCPDDDKARAPVHRRRHDAGRGAPDESCPPPCRSHMRPWPCRLASVPAIVNVSHGHREHPGVHKGQQEPPRNHLVEPSRPSPTAWSSRPTRTQPPQSRGVLPQTSASRPQTARPGRQRLSSPFTVRLTLKWVARNTS